MDQEFPRIKLGDKAQARLIAGKLGDQKVGPCLTHTKMVVFDVELQDKCEVRINLEEKTNTVILVLRGELEIQGQAAKEKDLIIFEREHNDIELKTTQYSKILVLNGEPIDEPVVATGPFVMNTTQEIMEAVRDYESGKMGHL